MPHALALTHPHLFDLPVSSYMSRDVEAVTGDAPLTAIVRAMHGRGVSAVPVLVGGKLTGVVSRTDLIELGFRQTGCRWTSPALPLPTRHARDIMTPTPLTIPPQASLRHAARMMAEHRVHRVFVVDDDEAPIGVVSTLELAAAVEKAGITTPVGDVMTSQIIAVEARTPLSAAVELLQRVPISALVVTDEELPIGTFTQGDALASRDLPRSTPIDETFDAGIICMPVDTKLYRAAAQAARLDVRRIVVCRDRQPVGLIGGLDFARVIAATRSVM
jgi:CBS domain-containing protein